jgi:hypothetical protein
MAVSNTKQTGYLILSKTEAFDDRNISVAGTAGSAGVVGVLPAPKNALVLTDPGNFCAVSSAARITPHVLKSSQSSVRVANSRVKWAAPWCEVLSLLLLFPSSVLAQSSPRELVVKMVQNELESQKDPRYWMYLDSRQKPGRTQVDRVVQTPECWVSWPVSVNGYTPTEKETREARNQVESLVNDPSARKKNRDEIDADSRKSAALLQLLPDAFQFTRDGRQGRSVRLKFRPDPGYRPRSNEAKVFHSMEGILLIDASQIRLAKLSGKLMSDVEFGFGILGKLQKGGTFEVVQSEVAPRDWEVSLLDVHITGRALLFHTIGEQQHEVRSDFQAVPPDLSLGDAASKATGNSNQALARSHGSR